jgi:hypothetical protein
MLCHSMGHMGVCVCVCVCVYMYVYIYICIYIYMAGGRLTQHRGLRVCTVAVM